MSDDLLRLEADPTLPESTGWRPRDIRGVSWALATAGGFRRLINENLECAADEVARIEARTAALNERLEKAERYLLAVVEEFARHNRDGLLVGRGKTRKLPTGSISFRKRGGRLVVEDKEAVIKWARSLPPGTPQVVRVETVVTPDVEAIRKYAATAREGGLLIPPGMRWEEEPEAVLVKATGSELLEGESNGND